MAELAAKNCLDEGVLQASLDRWNAFCREGEDEDFRRPPSSMVEIKTPPFYFGEIWPVVSNTQGGPVHSAKQEILNSFGEPIPRLYAAGELGSACSGTSTCREGTWPNALSAVRSPGGAQPLFLLGYELFWLCWSSKS